MTQTVQPPKVADAQDLEEFQLWLENRFEEVFSQIDQRFKLESLGVKREEAIREENRQRAANEKAEAEARKKSENQARWRPALFILAVLTSWLLIASLADAVITCIPGGAPCHPLDGGFLAPQSPVTRDQWILLIVGLLAALWVAKVLVYPNRDTPGNERAPA